MTIPAYSLAGMEVARSAACAVAPFMIAAEHQWQFDRLVYWLSDERPKFWPLPERGQSLLKKF